MNTSKGNEGTNDEGAAEIKVETVDYRKSAGREEEPHPEKVAVTHLIHDDNSGGLPGKVAEKLQSAKDAVAETNDEGAADIKVETVDYRKSAGREEEPYPEKVAVTHLIHDDNSGGLPGKVAEKLQSAKDAVAETTVKKTQ